MKYRNYSMAFLALSALAPAISDATNSSAPARACAAAFVSGMADQGLAAPGYKLDYYDQCTDSTLSDFYLSELTLTLEARHPKTGAAIARAAP